VIVQQLGACVAYIVIIADVLQPIAALFSDANGGKCLGSEGLTLDERDSYIRIPAVNFLSKFLLLIRK